MRFEGRELKPYADFVLASELKEGRVYFSLHYFDEELLIPAMEPVVFIGRNLEPDDVGQAYFQDVASYQRGVRHDSANTDHDVLFQSYTETKTGHVGAIMEFEPALEDLMRCALKRRSAAE